MMGVKPFYEDDIPDKARWNVINGETFLTCDFTRNFFQASCFICYENIHAEKIKDVNHLWNDEGYRGFPICIDCSKLVKDLDRFNYGDSLIKNEEKTMRKRKKPTLDEWM